MLSQQELNHQLSAYSATLRAYLAKGARTRQAVNWKAYAAVTGSAMAMATSASASVIYSGVLNATAGPIASLETNGANATRSNSGAIQLKNATGATFGASIKVFVKQKLASNNLTGSVGLIGNSHLGFLLNYPFPFVKHLSSGDKVSNAGPNVFEDGTVKVFGHAHTAGGSHNNSGWTVESGFLGFEFQTAPFATVEYGWIDLLFTDSPGNEAPNSVDVISWAYDNSGAGIEAGQTPAGFVPEPPTLALALLAAGAAGVATLRRRRLGAL